MSWTKKLIGNKEERAVSPVIGVILMVAITVILAAVIAAFVLDLGDTSSNPQAGFQIQEVADDNIEVTINSIERLDEVRISGDCDDSHVSGSGGWDTDEDNTDPGVGDSIVLDCDRDELQVIGTYDGDEAVMN